MDVPGPWIEPEFRQLLNDRHSVGAPAPAALRVALTALLGDEEIVTVDCYGRYEGAESFWECLAFTQTRLLQVTARRAVDHWNYYTDSTRDADANEPPPVITGTSRFLRNVRQVSLEGPSLTRDWQRFVEDPHWTWATGVKMSFADGSDVVTPLPSGSSYDQEDDEHVSKVMSLLAHSGVSGG